MCRLHIDILKYQLLIILYFPFVNKKNYAHENPSF